MKPVRLARHTTGDRWQRMGNQINAAMIFTRSDEVPASDAASASV
jgi:hypothetical protein